METAMILLADGWHRVKHYDEDIQDDEEYFICEEINPDNPFSKFSWFTLTGPRSSILAKRLVSADSVVTY